MHAIQDFPQLLVHNLVFGVGVVSVPEIEEIVALLLPFELRFVLVDEVVTNFVTVQGYARGTVVEGLKKLNCASEHVPQVFELCWYEVG